MCSSANIWADEILADYQASCGGQETTGDFLFTPENRREKRKMVAGKERAAVALRAFEAWWGKHGENSGSKSN